MLRINNNTNKNIKEVLQLAEKANNVSVNRTVGFAAIELLEKKSVFDPQQTKLDISEANILARLEAHNRKEEERRNASRVTGAKAFEVGDLVIYENKDREKLDSVFTGPYEIVKTNAHKTVFELDIGDKLVKSHLRFLKPYVDSENNTWSKPGKKHLTASSSIVPQKEGEELD